MQTSVKEDHRNQNLSNKLDFFDTVVGGVNRLKFFLGFNFYLNSHCDGELADMRMDKTANHFNFSYCAAVKGDQGGSDSSSAVLLGGDPL